MNKYRRSFWLVMLLVNKTELGNIKAPGVTSRWVFGLRKIWEDTLLYSWDDHTYGPPLHYMYAVCQGPR